MTFGIVTVVGYMVILGMTGHFVMSSLKKVLISRDSEVIDPKPENQY